MHALSLLAIRIEVSRVVETNQGPRHVIGDQHSSVDIHVDATFLSTLGISDTPCMEEDGVHKLWPT